MQNMNPVHHQLGRRAHLALALSLALGVSAAVAAQPDTAPIDQTAWIKSLPTYRQAHALEALQRAQPSTSEAHATHSTAGTITVTNCNDDGTGSLRWAVDNADNGDILDLSGLNCGTIKLNSSIITGVDNLTLQGRMTLKYDGLLVPSVIIDGQDTVEPIEHFGNGTLTLREMSVQNGHHFASGGGIFSTGHVKLVDSSVKYCNVEADGGLAASAAGGGIQARQVTLDNSLVAGNMVTNTGSGSAFGGGIRTTESAIVKNGSVIAENTAEVLGTGTAGGGGLQIEGDLQLIESRISDNQASENGASVSAVGGGANVYGTAILKHAEVNGNYSSAYGGGLHLRSASQIKYSTIRGNSAERLGGGLRAKTVPLTIDASTIADNHAGINGGGLQAEGDVSITYSTISGNTSQRTAGAMLGRHATQPIRIHQSTVSGNAGTNTWMSAGLYLQYHAQIRNSTITGNIETNNGNEANGAGICIKAGFHADLSSTIVAGNMLELINGTTFPSDLGECGGTGASLSGDHNLILESMLATPGDTISAAPELGPLRNNGGITWTHVPLAGSPAIDNGAANGFTTDQRGGNFARVRGAQADIGAVERISDRIFADNFEGP